MALKKSKKQSKVIKEEIEETIKDNSFELPK